MMNFAIVFSKMTRNIVLSSLVTIIVGSFTICFGAPVDVLMNPAPTGAGAEGTADENALVATSTGSAQYNYPISVVPGRLGMQPSLSLSYSSQGALRGGIANGWGELGIPHVVWDTSTGSLSANAYLASPRKQFTSSFSSAPFFKTAETPQGDVEATYRSREDGSIRYEKMKAGSYNWIARSLDGMIYYFGNTGVHPAENSPLVMQKDSFDNTIRYHWAKVPKSVTLSPIDSSAELPDRSIGGEGNQSTLIHDDMDSIIGVPGNPGDGSAEIPSPSSSGHNLPAWELVRIDYTSNPTASLDAFALVEFKYGDLAFCAGGCDRSLPRCLCC